MRKRGSRLFAGKVDPRFDPLTILLYAFFALFAFLFVVEKTEKQSKTPQKQAVFEGFLWYTRCDSNAWPSESESDVYIVKNVDM